MNPLQYTSDEMFSSTELIRKSKNIFDKLHNGEIEKAVILRDGKPSFMLLDFETYEKIMKEYLKIEPKPTIKKTVEIPPQEVKKEEEITSTDELNEKDLEAALAEIDNLNLDDLNINSSNTNNEDDKKESLKEFWE